jgi:hypothetical protein
MSDKDSADQRDVPTSVEEDEQEKKDKVLHTRISPTLDREIKRRARNLGMSVSTVVRNVLLHTFDLVEDIVNDSAGIALSIAGDDEENALQRKPGRPVHAKARRESGNHAVLAWQEAVLNINAVCERCNAILPAGTRAAIGIRSGPGPQAILCSACLEKIGPGENG